MALGLVDALEFEGFQVLHASKGRDAIERACLHGAPTYPTPATMAFRAWPRVTGNLDLDVSGAPGNAFAVVLALNQSQVQVPPFGWVFLAPPWLVLGAGQVGPGGIGTLTTPMAFTAPVVGLELFGQGVSGPTLTNLVRFRVLP